MKIAVTILQLLSALVLILIVLFQSGKSQGLSGAIGGIADSYMSRSKARSVDAKLAKATKWVGAIFVILTLVLNCMVAAGHFSHSGRRYRCPASAVCPRRANSSSTVTNSTPCSDKQSMACKAASTLVP